MSERSGGGPGLRCSFCEKPHAEVQKLIAGNKGVAICNECVDVCNDIVADGVGRRSSSDETGEPDLVPFRCPACGHHWRLAGRR